MNSRKTHRLNRIAIAGLVLAISIAFAMVAAAGASAEFGIAGFDQQITADLSGTPATQAGSHPYELTTTIALNNHLDPEFFNAPMPDGDARNIFVDVTPGLLGNPSAIPMCTMAELAGRVPQGGILPHTECPTGSQVGTIKLVVPLFSLFHTSGVFPVYRITPPSDMPAAFGFSVGGVPVTMAGNVRNGGDFGITVSSTNIPITLPIVSVELTFWGVPAEKSHDMQRCNVGVLTGLLNGECVEGETGPATGPHADPEPPRAFLTLPASCTPSGVGFSTRLRTDSWQNPGVFSESVLYNHASPGFPLAPSEWGPQLALEGCEFVPFSPSMQVEPTNHQADTPTGLDINFKLPQDGLINPTGIAPAAVRKAVVSLPAGLSVSPSAATGLGACSLAEIGLKDGNEPTCPDSSKIGSLEIYTPLLEAPLTGSIYLAKQSENPFGSLMAIYMVAQGSGVSIKLAGRIDLDPLTGQLVTTVEESPQQPFNELRLQFKGGPRSPLVNPHACGVYSARAVLTPWSGNPAADISSSFAITSGPNGSPCPAPQQFAPGFAIGTTNNQAGAFSPLSLTMTRADGDQQLGGVTMTTPTGLLGTLSSVKLCPEPQASQGTCGTDSQIGHLTAASGAGPNPFYVTGGKIYITGPYEGAPFGLSVVVPAKAGPFDLGTVIVRGAIRVDPHTAALTVTTDPLPTILDGIPLDLRVIDVDIDRSEFIFNPTDCNPMSITGTLTGGQGLTEAVGSPFQVTNCAVLGFKPSFKVSSSGKTSRTNGASLDAKLAYPAGVFGKQANIAKVKVSLPKQLPSRLQTLQKACPAEVFEANPASCPTASKIGIAKAHTPVLPVELSGPVYFVSHGGAAFPDLVVLLQGYDVTVQLVGNTFISKGVTSTTFNTIPDVPVETFELKLPQGKDSALAANGNLCTASLRMPTLFIAQDGATIKQSTSITPTGCTKHKPHHKHRKHKKKHGKK